MVSANFQEAGDKKVRGAPTFVLICHPVGVGMGWPGVDWCCALDLESKDGVGT